MTCEVTTSTSYWQELRSLINFVELIYLSLTRLHQHWHLEQSNLRWRTCLWWSSTSPLWCTCTCWAPGSKETGKRWWVVFTNSWEASPIPINVRRGVKKSRVKICHDRCDRQSCKICASCVNFSRKQCAFLQNLHRSSRFTLNKCDFTLNFTHSVEF